MGLLRFLRHDTNSKQGNAYRRRKGLSLFFFCLLEKRTNQQTWGLRAGGCTARGEEGETPE